MRYRRELRLWLAWHNGQSPDVIGAFESNWNLLSTRQIAEVKKELDAEASPNWNAAWVPFLDDDADNYVCIDARQPGFQCANAGVARRNMRSLPRR